MKTQISIKSLAMLVLCMCASQLLFAQGARFGLKAGYNIANIQIDGAQDLDSKSGYHFGFVLSVPVEERIYIQPGILYTLKGGKIRSEDTYELGNGTTVYYEERMDLSLSYLEIPVEFKYMIGNRFNVKATPFASFLLKDNVKAYSGACVGEACTAIEETIDDDDTEFQKSDFGIGLGIGYDITKHLTISTQYQFGMKKLVDDEIDAFNRMWSFSVGFTF